MDSLTQKDFVNLDAVVLREFVNRSGSFYLIEDGQKRCLLHLIPHFQYAFIIFNEGVSAETVIDDLKHRDYLLLLSTRRDSNKFFELKNTVAPTLNCVNIIYKFYAYVR
jgi:hypothetical protein